MFVHAIDPSLLNIFGLEIRFYGIVYVFGFLLGYYILNKERKKLKLNKKQADNFAFYCLIGLLIGARILHFLIDDIGIFVKDPLELLKIWHGGMSFYGGFFGVLAASYLYLKKRFVEFGNIIAIPVSFALILGRIANFINGEIIGTISNVSWCVVYSFVDNVCRHPYQIYAAISHTLLFSSLLIIRKYKEKKLFLSFVIGYAALRIITDFFREDTRILGLTIWQIISIIILIICGYFLIERFIKER